MLVSNDVKRDPRVRKSAQSLAEAGHKVGVIGVCYRGQATSWELQPEGFYVKLVALNQSTRARVKNVLASASPSAYQRLTKAYRWARKIPENRSANVKVATSDTTANGENTNKDEERRQVVQAAVRNRLARQKSLTNTLFEAAVQTWPSIIHCHDLDTLEAGIRTSNITGCSVVFDAHEIWWQQHAEDEAVPEWNDYFEEIESKYIVQTDLVITVCDSIANFFMEKHGIPRPTVVRNAIRLTAEQKSEQTDLRPSESPIEVLFHGGFAYNRGLEELLEAAKDFVNAKLILRGFGTLEDQLREYIEKNNLEDTVAFSSPVPMSQVVQAASTSDIGIIPYKPVCLNNRYSTPNKLFEFMTAGLSVVASDLPELKKVIESEKIGLTFEAGSAESIAKAINTLASDPERVTKMRAKARSAAQRRHNWTVEEKKLVTAYEHIPAPKGLSRIWKIQHAVRQYL